MKAMKAMKAKKAMKGRQPLLLLIFRCLKRMEWAAFEQMKSNEAANFDMKTNHAMILRALSKKKAMKAKAVVLAAPAMKAMKT